MREDPCTNSFVSVLVVGGRPPLCSSSQASAKQEIEQMGQAAKTMGVPQSRRLSSRAGGGSRAEAKSRGNSLGTGEPRSSLYLVSNLMVVACVEGFFPGSLVAASSLEKKHLPCLAVAYLHAAVI